MLTEPNMMVNLFALLMIKISFIPSGKKYQCLIMTTIVGMSAQKGSIFLSLVKRLFYTIRKKAVTK